MKTALELLNEDTMKLKTKLKKRNCQIADLKHRIKELQKKLDSTSYEEDNLKKRGFIIDR